jgi:hypothetical protein
VKANRYETGLAQCIGRRPSARATAKVARDAFARHHVNRITIVIAVPIVLSILRRCHRDECDQKQNREHGSDSQRPALPYSLAG